jgi:hypothetical protein
MSIGARVPWDATGRLTTMPEQMETCELCGTPMVCAHLVSLDATRASWRLCCLCTGELITRFSARREHADDA